MRDDEAHLWNMWLFTGNQLVKGVELNIYEIGGFIKLTHPRLHEKIIVILNS
jgi:hypothetical protein